MNNTAGEKARAIIADATPCQDYREENFAQENALNCGKEGLGPTPSQMQLLNHINVGVILSSSSCIVSSSRQSGA